MRMCLALALSAVIALPALAQPPRGGGMGGRGGAMLLTTQSVQEELKLTEEQTTKIKEFGDKARADMPKFDPNGDREEFQKAIKAMMEKGDKFAKETLTADQSKRLKQITLQQGGILGAVQNEETAKALKITDDQKTSLKEMGEAMMKDMQELRSGGGRPTPETTKKIAALRKEVSDKAVGTLTDEQKTMWKEMTGKAFEIKQEARPGGDRPNPGKKKNPDKDK